MPEYSNVEKPFLEKLNQIGWTVIDQGQGIPIDPAASLRTSFDEVALKSIFLDSVGAINPWATPAQLEYCYDRILRHGNKKLTDVNKAVFTMLRKGITLPGRNEQTGEENPTVRLVAMGDEYKLNSFVAINQFLVNTPSTAKQFIIPDIVCFVNGLPWIVVECKDFDVAEPMSDAYTQIRRYSNQREDYYSGDEGKEELFYTNLFNVMTYGTEARFGSISAEFDYFYKWTDIFPEVYKTIATEPHGERQEVMIRGMFNREILIDVFQNFTLYMEIKAGVEVKVLCRYQQYRAVGKMIEKLRQGQTWRDRSGVIWHTQGSGKSLTMVFLVKKMRSTFDLNDYKILMVVDRIDLEEQLGETAHLTGEKVKQIDNRKALVKLSDDTANLNIVMIHKFGINQNASADVLYRLGVVPKYETFEEINKGEKVLILIDEAHRSQGGDMNDNLFMAFPNATRFGFTGTPLITERHKIKTSERFCSNKDEYIDTYKMNHAVADKATVDLKYIGKNTFDTIPDKEVFDLEYEQTFAKRTEEERQEIQKRYGGMIEYLASKERVSAVARDVMTHFVTEILSNGYKAMMVTSSIIAAVRHKIELERLIPEFIALEEAKPEEERNKILLARLKILKVRAVISSIGNNEPDYITLARKEGMGKAVIDNFKKDYNTEDAGKAETGIGILCVCDRLLTGFDAPIAQVLYLDKNLREHDLLQAIARVNRTKKGKTHGLIVDYFGITKNLNRALGIYTDKEAEENREQLEEFGEYFKDINKEIPELELRLRKIIQFFEANGIDRIEDFLHQLISDNREEFRLVEDVIALAASMKLRAEFDTLTRSYFDRLDLLFNEPVTQRKHWVPAKRIGYLMWRIRYHYKDSTLDLKWASEKVRRLIDKHLVHVGITQRVDEVSILSDDFPLIINNLYRGSKSKASAMEHAIRQQIKVKLENSDPGLYQRFKDRIDAIITRYQGNWEQMIKELEEARQELNTGRKDEGKVAQEVAPIYDLIELSLEQTDNALDDKVIYLSNSLYETLREDMQVANFWEKPDMVRTMTGKIEQKIRRSGIESIKTKDGEIASNILTLAKANYKEIIKRKK